MQMRVTYGLICLTLFLSFSTFVSCIRDEDSGELRGLTWSDFSGDDNEKSQKPHTKMPEDISGTIAQYGSILSSQAPIGGPGVVVGLGTNGSSEIPSNLKSKLLSNLSNLGWGLASRDTENVKPIEVLRDLDTAIVRIAGIIPPGAPRGTRLDAYVSAVPRTQTKSLEGGLLLPSILTWQQGSGTKHRNLKTLATVKGPIFVNPFIDPTKRGAKSRLRQGKILNGIIVKKNMPLRLSLHKPDYHMSRQIQERINTHFGRKGRNDKIAIAKNPHVVEITVPRKYLHNYEHFLELVMHLPLRSAGGATEAKAARVAKAMEKPDVNYEGLTLVWEATGRQNLPTIQKVYASKNPTASFYAARTGLRLGDYKYAGPIVLKFAADEKSPLQLSAIKALGDAPMVIKAGPLLRKLVNSKNELIRIAAYESLVARQDWNTVRRYEIDKYSKSEPPSFIVDQVVSTGDFAIYATCTGQPKLVLFGQHMPLQNPLFPVIPGDIVTIYNDNPMTKGQIEKLLDKDPQTDVKLLRKEHVAVYRHIPGTESTSETFRIKFRVLDIIRILGSAPRPNPNTGKIEGLGFTYSQVVSILYRLCEQNSIPAKFVLQKTPEMQKIYGDTPAAGSPDRPDH
ncbi:MAG: flagellar basal body P-ring protein FlgI [Phycisphaerae bacterium]|nr:flagellar basal body P-ring protein FlgI [Phycisphaerae bacterium]